MEVNGIRTDRVRAAIESMTQNRVALELLAVGVNGLSSVVQPPCESPEPF